MMILNAGFLTFLILALITSYLGAWSKNNRITITALISGFLSGLMLWYIIINNYSMREFPALILGCIFAIVYSVLVVGGAYYNRHIREKSIESLKSRGYLGNKSDQSESNGSTPKK